MPFKNKKLILPAAFSAVLLLILLLNVRFNIKGYFEGFYLVKDKKSGKYELADHLFVGKGEKLIYGSSVKQEWISLLMPRHREDIAHLYFEWNSHDGSGFVNNHFPDGTRLVTYLGRYLDDDQEIHGLFVGGGLPAVIEQNINYNMNNSGMTYFDGNRWFHIWCSVNEGIVSSVSGEVFTPSRWEFTGSRVESKSSEKIVLSSNHKVVVDKVPLSIDRKMTFTAGAPYLALEVRITNRGATPVFFAYNYGDEPWVGYYGTSLGDVGWVRDRIINFEESVDSSKYSYAGFADLGNRVIGERPIYTNLANFIEWFGEVKPYVYLANNMNFPPEQGKKIPLESNERFLGLQWQRSLMPSESLTIQLAVGMAKFDPSTGIPEKPPVTWP